MANTILRLFPSCRLGQRVWLCVCVEWRLIVCETVSTMQQRAARELRKRWTHPKRHRRHEHTVTRNANAMWTRARRADTYDDVGIEIVRIFFSSMLCCLAVGDAIVRAMSDFINDDDCWKCHLLTTSCLWWDSSVMLIRWDWIETRLMRRF